MSLDLNTDGAAVEYMRLMRELVATRELVLERDAEISRKRELLAEWIAVEHPGPSFDLQRRTQEEIDRATGL